MAAFLRALAELLEDRPGPGLLLAAPVEAPEAAPRHALGEGLRMHHEVRGGGARRAEGGPAVCQAAGHLPGESATAAARPCFKEMPLGLLLGCFGGVFGGLGCIAGLRV